MTPPDESPEREVLVGDPSPRAHRPEARPRGHNEDSHGVLSGTPGPRSRLALLDRRLSLAAGTADGNDTDRQGGEADALPGPPILAQAEQGSPSATAGHPRSPHLLRRRGGTSSPPSSPAHDVLALRRPPQPVERSLLLQWTAAGSRPAGSSGVPSRQVVAGFNRPYLPRLAKTNAITCVYPATRDSVLAQTFARPRTDQDCVTWRGGIDPGLDCRLIPRNSDRGASRRRADRGVKAENSK
jgi:hypothetical protein